MTITAREAMQALLEGKVVTGLNTKWKLNGSGELIVEGVDGWNPSGNDLNHISSVVDDEYPLAFEQALKEMLNGKTVMCEVFNDRKYHFSDGWFRFHYHDDEWTQADWFEMRMRDAKWKVVE